MTRALKIGLVLLLGLVAAGLLLVVAMRMLVPDFSHYDRARWIAEQSAKPTDNRRSAMLPEIKARLRTGMTRDEVVALLGAPDGGDVRSDRFSYGLGMPGFGVDYEYFIVEFGGDGRVTRWRRELG